MDSLDDGAGRALVSYAAIPWGWCRLDGESMEEWWSFLQANARHCGGMENPNFGPDLELLKLQYPIFDIWLCIDGKPQWRVYAAASR